MRTRITLECTECKHRNYNMTKDKKTHPERMETKKKARYCNSHTLNKKQKYTLQKKLSVVIKKKAQKKNGLKVLT